MNRSRGRRALLYLAGVAFLLWLFWPRAWLPRFDDGAAPAAGR